jgi:SapC
MPKQLLIYEKAVPVTRQRHGNVSIKAGSDFGYAKTVNSVPLLASEFDLASREYAIVFSGQGNDMMPAALLGIRDNENLYVDDKGLWNAKYIPAFVRRYPFVFSTDFAGLPGAVRSDARLLPAPPGAQSARGDAGTVASSHGTTADARRLYDSQS